MGKIRVTIQKIIRSPYFSFAMGMMLLLCGILEATETIIEDFVNVEVKTHHGLILFGFGQILKSITDILEGTESIVVTEAVEKVEEKIKELE